MLVDVPVKRNRGVLAVFALDLFPATVGQANVEENIDLLGMAPETESPVVKMQQYSKEFEAGQVGMVLVNANVINDADQAKDDPVEILQKIDNPEAFNTVENTTAVSVVFLMKSSGVQVTVRALSSCTGRPHDVRCVRVARLPKANLTLILDLKKPKHLPLKARDWLFDVRFDVLALLCP